MTPNGHTTIHEDRYVVAAGGEAPVRKLGALSDAQARRIEQAAEAGSVFAPHYAMFSGDRAQITVCEKLAEKGLLVQIATSDGGRHFALTVEGWRVYRTHRLVIRRLSEKQVVAGEETAAKREEALRESGAGTSTSPHRPVWEV